MNASNGSAKGVQKVIDRDFKDEVMSRFHLFKTNLGDTND